MILKATPLYLWMSSYQASRLARDHAMAAIMAETIAQYWHARGDAVLVARWQARYEQHLARVE